MSRPLRIFLCHASQDKPAVWNLYRYLKQRGVQPWLDQADLLPGQNWEVEIPNALFASDVILVCLSKNSVNKEGYVQKEIAFALDKALEKPEGTIFIIPVKLEECEVPRRLGMYQWVDYFRTDGKRRLLLGLSLRAADLGDEVSPVLLDITRRRRSVESDSAEREAREKATREQKEKAEREAAEKLTREKAEQEAKEKAEREAKERLALEKAEQDAKEKAEREAREKAARQQAEREAAEKLVREKAEQEAKEKARREEIERRQTITTYAPEKAQPNPPAPKGLVSKPPQSFPTPMLALGSIILLGLLFWGISALLNREPAAPPEQSTATVTITPTLPTRTPTVTRTSAPPTFTPTPGIGSTRVSEKDGMVMVFVPAGEFRMGSNAGDSDEIPVHQVNLDAFWIDQTEVTNAMYTKCVADGGCAPPSSSRSVTRVSYYGNSEFDDYPVIYVDWNKAKNYCEWRGARLPTEAEWEKAARGTDGRTYPWGESVGCDKANYLNCVGDTTKVGSYLDGVSPYGMYDMAGNVWEWVNSLYQPYPYSADDGRENLSASGSRVRRGGSWGSSDDLVRSAFRSWVVPASSSYVVGFRCSLSQP